jgi:nitrogen fixation/metabolism regulation signal transduction histidine kinase
MKRSVGLQVKLTVALIVIVMTPLVVSYFLSDWIGTVAANFKANEASANVTAMTKGLEAYRELFETTKHLQAEIADRLSSRPELIALDPKAHLDGLLQEELSHSVSFTGLHGIAMLRPDGTVVAEATRPIDPKERDRLRDKVVDQPLGTSGASLRLTFTVSATLQDDYQKLKQAIDQARVITQIKTAIPTSIRTAFLMVMALFGLAAAAFGIFASTIVTRRIEALVITARRVSDGHLDARVELRGRDEMAELGSAFNTMLDDLDQTRAQLAYLQRMGVWQDVARRLAHEIKNPLTPIQLAVQHCVSSYKGDDARFGKLLRDAGEIVEEEIEGLRRLVDTFRTLGALPKVEKAPLELAEVIEELRLDPAMATRVTLKPPDEAVTVRADKLLLKRVLANLVENAIHAGEEAGTDAEVVIGWTADPRRDVVTITVDDHGKGVTDANREKIFEPYVTSKATGTGLGLAIARKIAIEHGGDLVLAPDRAPTGGARFVVSLPLRGPESSVI